MEANTNWDFREMTTSRKLVVAYGKIKLSDSMIKKQGYTRYTIEHRIRLNKSIQRLEVKLKEETGRQ